MMHHRPASQQPFPAVVHRQTRLSLYRSEGGPGGGSPWQALIFALLGAHSNVCGGACLGLGGFVSPRPPQVQRAPRVSFLGRREERGAGDLGNTLLSH